MKNLNIRFSVVAGLVLMAALSRLMIHTDNFTPIGAMALFGGAYFSNRWKAFLVPLLALFISDMLMQGLLYHGQYGFPLYSGWYWVYGSFALIVLLGRWIITKVSVKNVLIASVSGALAHWIISDFGVWIGGGFDLTTGTTYTKDGQGLLKCYVEAIPYMKSFFYGTAIYSVILFGGFELAQRKFPMLGKSQVAC
jgi:hypothetical protein